jgi:hypothetical protein
MAPGCRFDDDTLRPAQDLVQAAMDVMASPNLAATCPEAFKIPPDPAVSQAQIADRISKISEAVDNRGGNP